MISVRWTWTRVKSSERYTPFKASLGLRIPRWPGYQNSPNSIASKFIEIVRRVHIHAKTAANPVIDLRAAGPDAGDDFEGFLDYCAAHKLPLDFYSWHTYADGSADPYDAVRLAKQIRGVLDTHGFPKAESILSEWNLRADFTENEKQILQGAENAAYIGAVLNYLQDAPVDHAQFYRGAAAWMGLFDVQGQYFKTAYTFKAAGQMLASPKRLPVTSTDTFGVSAIAGRSWTATRFRFS